ncbi:unnamed protein product [Closterium sp. Yama58-4]|nr:unnamed protein product [Closterium sp. Yama58-4]
MLLSRHGGLSPPRLALPGDPLLQIRRLALRPRTTLVLSYSDWHHVLPSPYPSPPVHQQLQALQPFGLAGASLAGAALTGDIQGGAAALTSAALTSAAMAGDIRAGFLQATAIHGAAMQSFRNHPLLFPFRAHSQLPCASSFLHSSLLPLLYSPPLSASPPLAGQKGRPGGGRGGARVAGDGRSAVEGLCGGRGRMPHCLGWVPCGAWVLGAGWMTAHDWRATPAGTEGQGKGEGEYLMVQLRGGLNQMRAGICDAVVVAKMLGATLVLPLLDNSSWWADGSTFSDVFDAPHFIRSLAPSVRVVPHLPATLRGLPPVVRTVPKASSPDYYRQHVRPLIRWVSGIKYVALHLRYEPDMLAFTGCDYGGGRKERKLFERIRKRWPELPDQNPKQQRAKGKCLVTPLQVAVALKALGFTPSTRLYIASVELHGGPSALRPLLQAFPFATDKYSLARSLAPPGGKEGGVVDRDGSRREGGEGGAAEGAAAEWRGGGDEVVGRGVLEGLQGRKTLLAAVDYEMCRRGHMLVLNNNGNMAHVLLGQRRYDGVGNTVQLFGSSILRLLTAIQQGDAKSAHKLRNQTLRGDDSSGKAAVRGSFYSFPRECLCERSDHVPAGIYS